jgi:hypothetical protein
VRELTPTEKGAIAEAKIHAAAVEAGIVVARPLTEGRRYDLIFDLGTKLLRVQCKTAPRQGDVIVLRNVTNRCTPSGYVRTRYAATESTGSPPIALSSTSASTCRSRMSKARPPSIYGSPRLGMDSARALQWRPVIDLGL